MPINRADLRLLSGEPAALDKPADSGRMVKMFYCPNCLTRLWQHPQGADTLAVLRAGTLDNIDWAEPVGNIWTRSRVSWVAIDPNEPNFEGQPASRELLYGAWQERVTP